MKAQIYDIDKQVYVALRAIGFDTNTKEIETILNIYEYIKNSKTDVTLKEILILGEMIDELYAKE